MLRYVQFHEPSVSYSDRVRVHIRRTRPYSPTNCEIPVRFIIFFFKCNIHLIQVILFASDVKPGEMISFAQKFIPRFNGERKLVATFNSRELGDIVGSRLIHVRD